MLIAVRVTDKASLLDGETGQTTPKEQHKSVRIISHGIKSCFEY